MKVLTILGTRPEIIRLSQIIHKLDKWAEHHVLVHTGQNYDHTLSDVFFDELKVRKPNYHIHLKNHTFGKQVSQMFAGVEQVLIREQPDKVLVLGDTNSALCALLAERMGISVYHMEAGNRCYDTTVPEEINRKVIDTVSSYNIPYTPGSRENLLREGIHPTRVWMSGNPIYEVLQHYQSSIDQSHILEQFGLKENHYFVVTVHRSENVDSNERLQNIFAGLRMVANEFNYPMFISVHPRTAERLKRFQILVDHPNFILHEPLGLFDFIRLQRTASCVITDSGTVQEESCILGVPAVTIRQSTERPETILCGSNMLSGLTPKQILNCVQLMMNSPRSWSLPDGYCDLNVSMKLIQFLIGGLTYV